MLLKKLGNVSSLAEEKAKTDFFDACDLTTDLIYEFDSLGLDAGPAIGGALTQLLSYLMAVSPDTPTAMNMLSSCLSNAAYNIEDCQQTHEGNDLVH